MDDADLASMREEIALNIGINKLRKQFSGSNVVRDTEVFCEDCGEQIPPKRIEALPNAIRCVACQSLVE